MLEKEPVQSNSERREEADLTEPRDREPREHAEHSKCPRDRKWFSERQTGSEHTANS